MSARAGPGSMSTVVLCRAVSSFSTATSIASASALASGQCKFSSVRGSRREPRRHASTGCKAGKAHSAAVEWTRHINLASSSWSHPTGIESSGRARSLGISGVARCCVLQHRPGLPGRHSSDRHGPRSEQRDSLVEKVAAWAARLGVKRAELARKAKSGEATCQEGRRNGAMSR